MIQTGTTTLPFTTHQFEHFDRNCRLTTSMVALRGQPSQVCCSPRRSFSVSTGESAHPAQRLHEVNITGSAPNLANNPVDRCRQLPSEEDAIFAPSRIDRNSKRIASDFVTCRTRYCLTSSGVESFCRERRDGRQRGDREAIRPRRQGVLGRTRHADIGRRSLCALGLGVGLEKPQ